MPQTPDRTLHPRPSRPHPFPWTLAGHRLLGRRGGSALGLAVAGALALAGCTGPSGTGPAATEATGPQGSLPPGAGDGRLAVPAARGAGYARVSGTPAAAAVAASRTFFATARVAVLASEADGAVAQAAERARALGVPLLLVPGQAASAAPPQASGSGASGTGAAKDAAAPEAAQEAATQDVIREGAVKEDAAKAGAAVAAELSRLGVGSVEAYSVADTSFLAGIDVASPGSTPLPEAAAPATGPAGGRAAVVHLKDPGTLGAAGLAAVAATAQAAGAEVEELATADPRAERNRPFFAERAGGLVVAAGDGFGSAADFASTAATAAAGAELPGGGQLLFPQRRMVALYGHPGTPSLGLLGEQGIEASIARAKKLAADYQPYSDETVQPAFEIITTVATAHAGPDGKYSAYTAVEKLEPWIDAAAEAGVYVVLDLQPGRNDFLVQAKRYEELLKRPNVGLALDPEWRLGPNQRHMVQIGSVEAAEVNEVSAWLAGLVREHALPQKMLILHQFQLGMIRDRASLETGHPELALVLHADGHGTPGQKQDTWDALRRGLPPGIRMAWKNFIDEDKPTFSPRQTYSEVGPKPWFVSYQ